MAENDVAGIRQVLVSPQAGTALTQFQEVEGVQEDVLALALAPHALEHREAVLVTADGLAVDQTGPGPTPLSSCVRA